MSKMFMLSILISVIVRSFVRSFVRQDFTILPPAAKHTKIVGNSCSGLKMVPKLEGRKGGEEEGKTN